MASLSKCIDYMSRDQDEFKRLLSSSASSGEQAGSFTDYISTTRVFFDRALQQHGLCNVVAANLPRPYCSGASHERFILSACRLLVGTVLDSFRCLYFETCETDMQSVYERLAMRECMLSKGFNNPTPGVIMAEADLARCLLTSYGCGDDDDDTAQIRIYNNYWKPLELMATAQLPKLTRSDDIRGRSMETDCGGSVHISTGPLSTSILNYSNSSHFMGGIKSYGSSPQPTLTSVLNAFLRAFIEDSDGGILSGSGRSVGSNPSMQQPGAPVWSDPGQMFFPMYSKLKECIHSSLSARGLPVAMANPTPEAQEVVVQLLQQMLSFAKVYWKEN
eukprot:GHVN01003082.1.p1 GENE.GHVN01003082.1~~GHVN01003082.1.p1  ORF type:complete len:377 (-),score=32.79 GHVN01003082.1:710-1708(-)